MTVCLLFMTDCSGIRLDRPVKHQPLDWPMFARVPARTNATSEIIQPPLSLLWEQDVTGGIGSGSPLVVDSLVLVGNLRGELFAINAFTGKRIGWANLGEAIQGAPVVVGSTAIVACADMNESLSAFDLTSGKVQWRSSCGDVEVSPLLYENRIYVANTRGIAFCVDRTTGEVIWKFEIPDNTMQKGFRSSPAAEADRIVMGGENGNVYALDAENGKLKWTFRADASIVAPVGMSDSAVYVGDLNGTFYAINAATGHLNWKFTAGTSIFAGPTVTPHTVVIGTTEGKLFALDPTNGTVHWQTDLGGVINSSAIAAMDVLFIGTLKKQLFAVQIDNGAVLWSQEVPGRIKTSPAVSDGRLYVATDERLVLAFRGAKN